MNKPKPTIEIGIPALNEEANIGRLLRALLKQKQDSFDLLKISVVSDGSSDRTAAIARACDSGLVRVIEHGRRAGKAARQNEIIKQARADILVLLDADIAVDDDSFLAKLAGPVAAGEADASSCLYRALDPRGRLEKALALSLDAQNRVFAEYRQGDNLYACKGTSRALARRFYQKLLFQDSIGEDMYTYLRLKEAGLRFALVKDAMAGVKVPSGFDCHFRQSARFILAKRKLSEQFGAKLAATEFALPGRLLARHFAAVFSRAPLGLLYYILVSALVRLRLAGGQSLPDLWPVSASSKDPSGVYRQEEDPAPARLISLRRLAYAAIGFAGRFYPRPYPRATVFCHHSIADDDWRFSVAPADFKQQIGWLLERFDPVSLPELERFLNKELEPKRPVFALTFDDGYRDILAIKDYLAEQGIKPALFVLSRPDQADRAALDSRRELLAAEEIRSLKALGWEIGCHGATHRDFKAMDERSARAEIAGAKKELETALGCAVNYFAYPKGYHDARLRRLAAAAGYRLAFSLDDKKLGAGTDRFSLPRVGVDGTHSFAEFKVIASKTAVRARGIVKQAWRMGDWAAGFKNRLMDLRPFWHIRMFFANRLVTINRTHRLSLPEKIDDYELVDTIFRPQGDNQYQFGIYENTAGKKGILKMWDGGKKDGDWFWLDNEIKTYEGLDELFKQNGAVVQAKFPDIKLPRLIKRIEDKGRLGLFMEMLQGGDLNEEKDLKKIVLKFERVIRYFRYLGEAISRGGSGRKFVRRDNLHASFIFFYMFFRAVLIYPAKTRILAKALFSFLAGLPCLLRGDKMAFVHRDLTYTNILSLAGGRIGVIDLELAVVANPLYEITQAVTGSWRRTGFWQEFYRLDIMKEILADKHELCRYRTLTIFTAVHRLATSPKKDFDMHYSYLLHGFSLK